MRFARQLGVPLVQGRGSFGAVYLCIDKREGRKCVGSSLTTPGRTGHAEPTRTIHQQRVHSPSGTHGTCACARVYGEPAQSSRPGSCGGTAAVRLFDRSRLSEACRCVMKKLPFAPNLEARAGLLSTVATAAEWLSSVARCGGVVLCCNSTGSRFRWRTAAAHGGLAADRRSTSGLGHIACCHSRSRRSAVPSHSLSIHCCTRMASAAGATVALQRCAK